MKMRIYIIVVGFAVITGCTIGPEYHRPQPIVSQPLPAAFSGAGGATNVIEWKIAQPSADLPHGTWWEIFNSAELDRLEPLAATNSQNLAAMAAQFEQARALVKMARADYFPQLSAQPNFIRQRSSVNAPENGVPTGAAFSFNTIMAPLDLGWELDLWGRVRRQTDSAQARFVAIADDFESAKLSLQAEIASDYFMLRALDAEHALVAGTISAYRSSLELTQNRRAGGIASDLDVSQAESQLRITEAELPALDLQRETLRHAIATLCGQPATGFQLAPENFESNAIPALPVSVPGELLERRPDIAAAERRVVAANADIGVAQSAFYPNISLGGEVGYESMKASNLFNWPSRMWALGPSVNFPLFTGGRNSAQLAAARAAYDVTIANYRETVLTAFREVEDELSAQCLLAAQFHAQNAALGAARHTLEIASNRYRAGLITYLEVATAQSFALSTERTLVQLAGQRLVTEVALIKALGGGWQPSLCASPTR